MLMLKRAIRRRYFIVMRLLGMPIFVRMLVMMRVIVLLFPPMFLARQVFFPIDPHIDLRS